MDAAQDKAELEAKQQAIIDEFLAMRDWQDRYRRLIQIGKELPALDEAHKLDQNLVKGCQNRAWLHAERDDSGVVRYLADSEAMIVRGFIALLVRVYSGHLPATILSSPPRLIEEIELGENLSLSRANGLAAVVKQIKLYAMAFAALSAKA